MQRPLLVTVLVLALPGIATAQLEPAPAPAPAPPVESTQPEPVAEPALVTDPEPVALPKPLAAAEPVAAPEPQAANPMGSATVGYEKGFLIQSADEAFKLVIGGRVQGRFELSNEKVDDDNRDTSSAFSIPRTRIVLKGHAFTKDVKYKIETDLGKGFLSLKDGYIDFKMGTPVVRVGQFKRPFSRQQLTSSGKQEFVDRAITNGGFPTGRDIGVMAHNNYTSSPEIEWAVGVFNGTGDKATLEVEVDPVTGETTGSFSNVPDDLQPQLVARGGYNQGGINGYSEADFEGGPLRFAVGGSLLTSFDNDGDDSSTIAGQVDAMVKSNGLTASAAVYVSSAQDGGGFADQAYAAVGFHAQAGYLLEGDMQPAIRYAIVAPDEVDASHEISAAFSIYKFKHGLKWQTDVGLLGPTSGIADEFRLRTQLQLSF